MIVTLLLSGPEAPDTVTLNVPIAALLLAENVTRHVLVAGLLPNTAVTPPGKPDAVKFTLPLNPFIGLIVTVLEPDAPCRSASAEDAAERVKLGCGPADGQLLTKFAAFTVPIPVAKSQPTFVP